VKVTILIWEVHREKEDMEGQLKQSAKSRRSKQDLERSKLVQQKVSYLFSESIFSQGQALCPLIFLGFLKIDEIEQLKKELETAQKNEETSKIKAIKTDHENSVFSFTFDLYRQSLIWIHCICRGITNEDR
jgi:hypothetical protein